MARTKSLAIVISPSGVFNTTSLSLISLTVVLKYAGMRTSKLFIENTRHHAELIVNHILSKEEKPS